MSTPVVRVSAIVGSAVVHAGAFPPWEHSWLAWCALIPFFLALRGLTPGQGFAAGWLWGTAAIWVVAHWVPAALRFYYEQPWWFAILFCVIGSQVLWGTYYAAFGTAAAIILRHTSGAVQVVLVAAAWVVAELARAHWLTGEPWMLLGYGLVSDLRMIQVADLGGVYLVSFVVVVANATGALIIATNRGRRAAGPCTVADSQRPPSAIPDGMEPSDRRFIGSSGTPNCGYDREESSHAASDVPHASAGRDLSSCYGAIAVAATLAASSWGYGSLRLAQAYPVDSQVEVVAIQGNVALGMQWQPEFHARGLETYIELSEEALRKKPADLLIWPESAVTFFLTEEEALLGRIRSLLDEFDVGLVVGGPHVDDSDPAVPLYFNSGFHLTADGIVGRYDKAHLLPFGEYFPLKTIEFLRRRFERVRTFTPGDGETLLETPAGRAAVVICFEAIFPEKVRRQMRRGAGWLVNLTNDVWLGSHAGPRQHASMVVFRAIENRVWVVRATTTGVSAIIDPHGIVVARSETDVPATLRARVGARTGGTLYQWIGDTFAFGCAAALVFAALFGLTRHHSAQR